MGRVHTPALGAEVHRVLEQFGGEHTVGDDALVVVQVVDEMVDGREALLQAGLDTPPFVSCDDTRDDVERPGTVDATPVGVHRERDALREDVEVGTVLTLLQFGLFEGPELFHQHPRRGAGRTVGGEQLVVHIGLGAHVGHRHAHSFAHPCVGLMPEL